MTILAGDVGGTKTVIALFATDEFGAKKEHEEVFASGEHETFDEILDEFCSRCGNPSVESACFGVAGAVINGEVETTNLPWTMSESQLSQSLGGVPVKILNDLEATAYGSQFLSSEDRIVLQQGIDRRGNVAVIAAGTGLGQSFLVWDGERHRPVATEGGHGDFAPVNDTQIDLLQGLQQKLAGRVSNEHVLSGPGFARIYDWLRETRATPEPLELTRQIQELGTSAAVSKAALAKSDPVATEALELFVDIYGQEAGNIALRTMALGGVVIAGGIAPKIAPALQTGAFMDAFRNKGHFSGLLAEIPVFIALNQRLPLKGAAEFARSLTGFASVGTRPV